MMRVVSCETRMGGLGRNSCQQNQAMKRIAAASHRRTVVRLRGASDAGWGIESFTLKPSLLTAAPFPLCSITRFSPGGRDGRQPHRLDRLLPLQKSCGREVVPLYQLGRVASGADRDGEGYGTSRTELAHDTTIPSGTMQADRFSRMRENGLREHKVRHKAYRCLRP